MNRKAYLLVALASATTVALAGCSQNTASPSSSGGGGSSAPAASSPAGAGSSAAGSSPAGSTAAGSGAGGSSAAGSSAAGSSAGGSSTGGSSAAGSSGAETAGAGSGSAGSSGADTAGAGSSSAGGSGTTGSSPAGTSGMFTLPSAKPGAAKTAIKVALVRQSGIGDYFQQWGSGLTAQLKAVGAVVTTFDARNDNAKQATDFDTAIAAKPDVIIVDHGLSDTINPKVDKAIAAGIPVVVYDVAITNTKAFYLSQDDASIATKILDYLKQDNPSGGKIAYVNVSGIAPLDSRDKVYQQFLKTNTSFTQSAHFGKYTASVAIDTASEGAASLKSAPSTTIAFCAYDELCKGTIIALRQDSMSKVKIYGVDISTADIQLMTAAGSQWRATAATDPANVGAIMARAAIAAGDGIDLPSKMVIPAALITQDLLKKDNVNDMPGLRKAIPDLNTPEILGASWIPTITPGA